MTAHKNDHPDDMLIEDDRNDMDDSLEEIKANNPYEMDDEF